MESNGLLTHGRSSGKYMFVGFHQLEGGSMYHCHLCFARLVEVTDYRKYKRDGCLHRDSACEHVFECGTKVVTFKDGERDVIKGEDCI